MSTQIIPAASFICGISRPSDDIDPRVAFLQGCCLFVPFGSEPCKKRRIFSAEFCSTGTIAGGGGRVGQTALGALAQPLKSVSQASIDAADFFIALVPQFGSGALVELAGFLGGVLALKFGCIPLCLL